MADLLAIISKVQFEGSGEIPQLGERLRIDRYSSANKALKPLGEGGRLFLVTVRPPEMLWLVGVLDQPKFDGQEWIAPVPSTIAITDITKLKSRLKFATGKGIAASGALGAALQTPRALADADVTMLEAALGAPVEADEADDEADEPAQLRRVDDRETLAHRIERGKSARAKCATCELGLAKGAVRLAEVYMHGDIRNPIYRYHHLACAVTAVPMVVRTALRTLAEPDLVPDRDAIAAQIDARIAALAADKRARYATTPAAPVSTAGSALLAQLADDPDDPATLAVLADELTAADDPRGELITVQLAVAAGNTDGALIERRAELIRVLSPKLDPGDRMQWSVGYVRRVELLRKTATRMDELTNLWRHPSLALVRELHLDFDGAREGAPAVEALVPIAPRSLVRLELGDFHDHGLGDVAALIAALPKLASLALHGRTELGALAHATLARLELYTGYSGEDFGRAFAAILPARLPTLRALAIHAPTQRLSDRQPLRLSDIIEALVARPWLRQLDTLELARGRLEADDIGALAETLGKRKLARLDLATCDIALRLRPSLAALCTELVFPAAAVVAAAAEATRAEHTAKPEWGIGKITARRDGKIEINFGKKIGVKVFKADAPFLKLT